MDSIIHLEECSCSDASSIFMKSFILHCSMVNTKTTPRKAKEICPVCFVELDGKDAWSEHVLSCASSMMVCKACHVSFKKKEYLQKHMRTKHPDAPSSTQKGPSHDQEDDSDWDVDPEVQLGEVRTEPAEIEMDQTLPSTSQEDYISGRVVRKRTAPSPVFSSKRTNFGVVEETGPKKSADLGIQTDNMDPVLSKIMVDEATQTEGYHRRVKEITITKYHENGQKIKRIKESEELFDL